MPTLKQIIDTVKPDWNYPFDDRDLFEEIGADKLSFNSGGVVADGVEIVCERPRLMFARVLRLYPLPFLCYGDGIAALSDLYAKNGGLGFTHGYSCIIGGPGFGYETDENGMPIRLPHLGNVVIGKNVELGSNVCIDRAVIGSTVIGDNVKIDNLVHIAHGAKIGKNTLIVAGSVIGGSCEIGENCFIGMNASIKNKVKIGNNVTIGAGAVVLKDVPDGETWVGNPARKLENKLASKEVEMDFTIKDSANAKEVPMPITDFINGANDDLASK